MHVAMLERPNQVAMSSLLEEQHSTVVERAQQQRIRLVNEHRRANISRDDDKGISKHSLYPEKPLLRAVHLPMSCSLPFVVCSELYPRLEREDESNCC
jgi:hypothetical protein